MSRACLVAAATAAMLPLGGCGFGNGDDGDGITREEYTRRADAICLDTQLAVEGLPQPRTIAELGPFAQRYFPLLERQVTRLREVELPEGDEEAARELITGFEATAETWSRIATAARAGNERRVQELLIESREHTLAIRDLSERLGLQVCAPQV